MKTSNVLVVVGLSTLCAVLGIKVQGNTPAASGISKTFVQKLEGVESVELRFVEKLSGYAVLLLTRQEARDRAGRSAEQPENIDARQQEARRIAAQFYGANLGVTPPPAGDTAAKPTNEPPRRCYDIAEMGVDYVSLTAIGLDDPSLILPVSRIAYVVSSEPNAD